MKTHWEGSVDIASDQLDLDFTLLGGQSFRWEKKRTGRQLIWTGVAFEAYWELRQTDHAVDYRVYPILNSEKCENYSTIFFNNLLKKYFRVEFDLNAAINLWKIRDSNFAQVANKINAVRVLDQEPFENILSFICSQNNHIRRISTMIQSLCSKYGKKIGTFNGKEQFTFPNLADLVNQEKLESELRDAKFGYRSKFLSRTVASITEYGGMKWLADLKVVPYEKARLQLIKLPGIGLKVADCICLMSLGHLQSVPIDTHIFKIVRSSYMPQYSKLKSITPKVYEEIGGKLRSIYGEYAGWAQTILFCADLRIFQKS